MYLLDTNVCIDFSLARNDALPGHFRRAYAQGLAISTITLAELRVGTKHGAGDPEDEKRLDLLIATLAVHPFDVAAAATYGRLARELGVKRRSFDRLIAAHAVSLNLTLVTRNGADFRNVPGLRLEDWTNPA